SRGSWCAAAGAIPAGTPRPAGSPIPAPRLGGVGERRDDAAAPVEGGVEPAGEERGLGAIRRGDREPREGGRRLTDRREIEEVREGGAPSGEAGPADVGQ